MDARMLILLGRKWERNGAEWPHIERQGNWLVVFRDYGPAGSRKPQPISCICAAIGTGRGRRRIITITTRPASKRIYCERKGRDEMQERIEQRQQGSDIAALHQSADCGLREMLEARTRTGTLWILGEGGANCGRLWNRIIVRRVHLLQFSLE